MVTGIDECLLQESLGKEEVVKVIGKAVLFSYIFHGLFVIHFWELKKGNHPPEEQPPYLPVSALRWKLFFFVVIL